MKKLGFCIGINHYGGNNNLAGCVNDARDWTAELIRRGFTVRGLLDRAATRSAIVRNLSDAVRQTVSGDLLVVTYSGHGTWQPDRNGDEPDARDEAWCPSDLRTAGVLLDDDLAAIFAKAKPGVRIVVISDSCHSGTVTRSLPRGNDDQYTKHAIRFLPPTAVKASRRDVERIANAFRPKARELGDVLLLAGCQDWEYSYDAVFPGKPVQFGGRANGAFTRAAIDTLNRLPTGTTYADWFKAIRQVLPSRAYPQTPNAVGSAAQLQQPVFA